MERAGEPKYRTRQVLAALCAGASSYEAITTLPGELREDLSRGVPLLSFEAAQVLASRDQTAHKGQLKLRDGKMIETVLMQSRPGLWSVCVSSQVGCALKCNFCATGLMGFTRNLTAEEISDQVLFWKQYMRRQNIEGQLSNVVYMGMGEPMLNFDQVKESIRNLTDPELFGLGHRSIAVSTAGVAPGIDRFADEMSQVNLALSLHAANNALRNRLVPVNKAYPLEELKKSLQRYFKKNKRKVFIEYVLLSGENDRLEHAKELIRFIRDVGSVHLLHVNLIVWNPTDTSHVSSQRETAMKFKEFLLARGVHATLRKNLGLDISGACGQLVIRKEAAR